jgi:excisionase family DNA binding protein
MEIALSSQGTPVPCPYLTTPQAAAYLGISPRTLEDWRLTGFGPSFMKLGRRVLYRMQDLLDFIEARLRRNTGEH